ncbi:MAG: Hsp20/alpha crystallin family protein [Promethearchaeota archaeon]|nr:MAG: Hsp20/alpha crystallin family protein [Candidatus Lokiarchaeota archaeon]
MNENHDVKEDVEFEKEVDSEKKILEEKKKQEEITLKRKQVCHFKTDHPDTLEIKQDEPYYRTPLTNILESEVLYYILVELPGLDKKHVKISLQEGILELRGEKEIKKKEKKDDKKDKDKKDEKKDKEKKKEKDKEIKGTFLRRDIRSTNFYTCFHLPDDISTEEIDASFKNGILRLKLPKKGADISEKKIIEIK